MASSQDLTRGVLHTASTTLPPFDVGRFTWSQPQGEGSETPPAHSESENECKENAEGSESEQGGEQGGDQGGEDGDGQGGEQGGEDEDD